MNLKHRVTYFHYNIQCHCQSTHQVKINHFHYFSHESSFLHIQLCREENYMNKEVRFKKINNLKIPPKNDKKAILIT